MRKFYTVSIEDDTAYITYQLLNKGILALLDCWSVPSEELATFFKKKYPLFVCAKLPFIVSDQIKVPTAIKNKSVIKKYISHKISTNLNKQKPLFVYDKLFEQNDDKNTEYKVDAISEQSLMKTLSLLGDTDIIKSSTVDKYALAGIANSCIDKKSYICIYANKKTVTTLAISQKELLFSRSVSIEAGSDETYKSDRDSFINQTISYIRQQFRDIQFTNIVMCGNLATDEDIATQLNMLYNLAISVLTPNIKNFPNEKIQTFIISIGAYFTPKKSRFMPDSLLGNIQFKYIVNIMLIFSSVILLAFLYLGYNSYKTHKNLLQRYSTIKSKLEFELNHTKTLSSSKLKKSYYEMKIRDKYLNQTPISLLTNIKPLVLMLKPAGMKWRNSGGKIHLELFFIKHFTTLMAMYKFENSFNHALEAIKSGDKLTSKFLPDYTTMTFKAVVILKQPSKIIRSRRKI